MKSENFDLVIYIPKHQWQKKLPFWVLRLITKPQVIYQNCKLVSVDSMKFDTDCVTQNVIIEYEKFK